MNINTLITLSLRKIGVYDRLWALKHRGAIRKNGVILKMPAPILKRELMPDDYYHYYFFAELKQYHHQYILKSTSSEYLVKGVPFSVFRLDKSYDEYFNKCIKSAERALIRKAIKNGYTAREITYDEYLTEIQIINNSKVVRSAGKMSSDYVHVRPRDIVTREYNCNVYTFGCFSADNKLVAYYMFEKMTNFYHTVKGIGHGEHLSNGVMNYLLAFSVAELASKNQCEYIVYGPHIGDGLSNFKSHAGFESKYLLLSGNRVSFDQLAQFNCKFVLHGDTALNFIADYCQK